ncbi:MAG: hypothetical protein J6J23_02885, partial [Clostridia bacterium]|nr:hypothetical protein [Clostridia bacterium]
RAALASYATLRSSGSVDLSAYNAEMQKGNTAQTEYAKFDVPHILDNAETAQRAVITATNAIETKFNSEKPVLSGLTLGGIDRSEARDAFDDLKSAVDYAESVFAGFATTMSNDAIFRYNATFKSNYEKEAKETYFQYRVTYSQAWQKFTEATAVDARINSNVGTPTGLTNGEKNDYDRVKGELSSYNTQIGTMNTDPARRDECERYVVGAEVKAGLIRAYSELQKARASGDATKVAGITTEITNLKTLESEYSIPGSDIETIRTNLMISITNIEALSAGRFVRLSTGERVFEADYERKITELVGELDPLVRDSQTRRRNMNNRSGVYADEARERATTVGNIVTKLSDIQMLISAKNAIDSAYSLDTYKTERESARREASTPDPKEKKYTVDSVRYYNEDEFASLRTAKSRDLTNAIGAEQEAFRLIQTEFPTGAPDPSDPTFARYTALVNDRNTKAGAVKTIADELSAINTAYDNNATITAKVTSARKRATALVAIGGVPVFRKSEIDTKITLQNTDLRSFITTAGTQYTAMENATNHVDYETAKTARANAIRECGKKQRILREMLQEKHSSDTAYDVNTSTEPEAQTIKDAMTEISRGMPAEKVPTVKVDGVDYTLRQLQVEIGKQLAELDPIAKKAEELSTDLSSITDPSAYTSKYNERKALIETEDTGIKDRLDKLQPYLDALTQPAPAGFGETLTSTLKKIFKRAKDERDSSIPSTPTPPTRFYTYNGRSYTEAEIKQLRSDKDSELSGALAEEVRALINLQVAFPGGIPADGTPERANYDALKQAREDKADVVKGFANELEEINNAYDSDTTFDDVVKDARAKASPLVEIQKVYPIRESDRDNRIAQLREGLFQETRDEADLMRDIVASSDDRSSEQYKNAVSERNTCVERIKKFADELEALNNSYKNDPDIQTEIANARAQASPLIEVENVTPFRKAELESTIADLIDGPTGLNAELEIESDCIRELRQNLWKYNDEATNKYETAKRTREGTCERIKILTDAIDALNAERETPDANLKNTVTDPARAKASALVEFKVVRVVHNDGLPKATMRVTALPGRETDLRACADSSGATLVTFIKEAEKAESVSDKYEPIRKVKRKSVHLKLICDEIIDRAVDKDAEKENLKEHLALIEKAEQMVSDFEASLTAQNEPPAPEQPPVVEVDNEQQEEERKLQETEDFIEIRELAVNASLSIVRQTIEEYKVAEIGSLKEAELERQFVNAMESVIRRSQSLMQKGFTLTADYPDNETYAEIAKQIDQFVEGVEEAINQAVEEMLQAQTKKNDEQRRQEEAEMWEAWRNVNDGSYNEAQVRDEETADWEAHERELAEAEAEEDAYWA